MSAILEDPLQFVLAAYRPLAKSSFDRNVCLRILEWHDDHVTPPQDIKIDSVDDLLGRDQDRSSKCSLRIVLTQQRPTRTDTQWDTFRAVYEHYSFPSAWFEGERCGVTHSFGSQRVDFDSSFEVAWIRLVVNDVQIRSSKVVDGVQFYDIVPSANTHSVGKTPASGSQDSKGWWHMSSFLHVRSKPTGLKCVTLFCFDRPDSLDARFEQLLPSDSWRDAVEEPYLLLSIMLEKWYQNLDAVAWNLADVFRPVEYWTLRYANRGKGTGGTVQQAHLDFTGLHNLSKHCIYLLEAANAALLTLESIASNHEDRHKNSANALSRAVTTSLAYRKTTFESTQLRLRSLEKRMANLIGLSFNLVAREDSRTMKVDSNAMKTIAVLTLIFLPLASFSSVFSMPFFSIDFDSQHRPLRIAQCFWIFWVLVVPLTGILFAMWIFWCRRHAHII